MLGQLVDRVAAVAQDAGIAVDVGDLRAARGGVGEARVIGDQAGLGQQLAHVGAGRALGGGPDRQVAGRRRCWAGTRRRRRWWRSRSCLSSFVGRRFEPYVAGSGPGLPQPIGCALWHACVRRWSSPASGRPAWALVTDWPAHGRWIPLTTVTIDADSPASQGWVPGSPAAPRLGPVGFDDPMTVTQLAAAGPATAAAAAGWSSAGRWLTGWAEIEVRPSGAGSRLVWTEDISAALDAEGGRPGGGPGRHGAVRPDAAPGGRRAAQAEPSELALVEISGDSD